MKLHDLRPADGSRKPRTRVGRGIAAGKGKTAGRGTKGQKARAGGSIPPWFEGGQTPLHMRIPKLRGFKNRFKIEYEVVNIGAIGALAERGAFEVDTTTHKGAKAGPVTVNQDILRAVGLVRTLNKPLKILGAGELSAPLFVVADAFTGRRSQQDRGRRRQRQRARGPGHAAGRPGRDGRTGSRRCPVGGRSAQPRRTAAANKPAAAKKPAAAGKPRHRQAAAAAKPAAAAKAAAAEPAATEADAEATAEPAEAIEPETSRNARVDESAEAEKASGGDA